MLEKFNIVVNPIYPHILNPFEIEPKKSMPKPKKNPAIRTFFLKSASIKAIPKKVRNMIKLTTVNFGISINHTRP